MIDETLEQILIGTVLGDGHIQKTQSKTNLCRLRINHSTKQKAYLDWKYSYFASICPSEPKKEAKEESYRFYTYYRDDLIFYHDMFYEKNQTDHYRKKIDPSLISFLKTPLALAVWYLDDGSFRGNFEAARIATNSFSLEEIRILQEILRINFSIPSHIVKAGKSRISNNQWYNLSLNAKDKGFFQFKDAIYDIVRLEIPTMLYKLEKPCND